MNLSITPLSPRARRSTSIADNLRNLITSGQLKPGDKLPTESLLCQQYGVSRTTLREAIQMLRTTGLLDVTPGRGSFVRIPNMRRMLADFALISRTGQILPSEIRTVRLLLQRDILTRLSRTPHAKKKELYQHVLIRAAAAEDNAQLETNWHLCMAELAGNTLQKLFLESLLLMERDERIARYRDPDEVMHTIHIQMRTNTAIADGNMPLAERVLSQFIEAYTRTPATPAYTNGTLPTQSAEVA